MSMLWIALLMGLFVYKAVAPALQAQPWPGWSDATLLAVVLIPKAAMAAGYALLGRWAYQQLRGAGAGQALQRMRQGTWLYHLLSVGLFGMDLALGLLPLVERTLGQWILLDELVVLAPTLGLWVWGWWVFYPLERRLREAALIRELDAGQPLKAIPSRGRDVANQLRHESAVMGVPLLLILAWYETVPWFISQEQAMLQTLTQWAGAIAVFALAPLMIRYIWNTTPMPDGPMRQHLQSLCDQHRVPVRNMLLWRTPRPMVNAAVMGFVAPLRYILLTESLLEQLPQSQVEAVMAHELGHVRKKHMFWLIASTLASLGLAEQALGALLPEFFPHFMPSGSAGLAIASGIGALAVTALALGWVSRRLERQADTFALQHLVAQHDPGSQATVDRLSVGLMVNMLGQVATLNRVATCRSNWRHGSIAWRQAYLQRLVGQRVSELSIDQQVRWIQLASLIALTWLILGPVAMIL